VGDSGDGASSNRACATYPTIARSSDVIWLVNTIYGSSNGPLMSVSVIAVGASNNRVCATCPIVATVY
jgi:hypothetical protein